MGCDCCKDWSPKDWRRCQDKRKNSNGYFKAPCGEEIGRRPYGIGSSYTPPKKKRRMK